MHWIGPGLILISRCILHRSKQNNQAYDLLHDPLHGSPMHGPPAPASIIRALLPAQTNDPHWLVNLYMTESMKVKNDVGEFPVWMFPVWNNDANH
jgi:hypothetical protein